jgi:dTDP-4-amino-4,6-dideoxygalactose transaminase
MSSKNPTDSTNSMNPTNPIDPPGSVNQTHVPILDLTRQYRSIKDEIDEAVQRVVASGRYVLGEEVQAFEQEVAAFCGVNHAIGVASGTDALLLSLRALGIGQGDKVIVPSFTFFATAGVVHNVGATPVFADIDPDTFNIDPSEIRRRLTQDARLRTQVKAIIPVHLYGQMADMDELMAIAKQYDLSVVEDAAQVIGAEHKGQKAGAVGHLGCFSFYPTKNLGAYGDGGMVITNDEALAGRVRLLRAHGAEPKYYHHMVGVNSRLDALQAAILRVKLPHLSEWSRARQGVADRYDERFSAMGGIAPPVRSSGRTHIFHQYTIRVLDGKREPLRQYLREQGIGTMIYYPRPLHLQECFEGLGYSVGDLPHSEAASEAVLSLPIFPELTEQEQDHVVRAVEDFLSKG